MESDLEVLSTATPELEAKAVTLLMAEYEHLGASFLASEAAGEKRVNTFLTVIGAAIAALGLGAESLKGYWAQAILALAVVSLSFGMMTLRRIMGRNIATTEYVNGLRRIRAWWIGCEPGLLHILPYVPGPKPGTRESDILGGIGKAGWLETIAVINCLLVAVASACSVWLWFDGMPESDHEWVGGAVVIVVLFATTWMLQGWWSGRVYKDLTKKSNSARSKAVGYWEGKSGG